MAKRSRMILFMAAAMFMVAAALAAPGLAAQSNARDQQIAHLNAQLHKSKSVVNFWNHRGRWALYLKYDKCWHVKEQDARKMCVFARGSLRFHGKQITQLSKRLAVLVGPEWCRSQSGNRKLGCRMAEKYWPSKTEWNALEELWQNESGWDEHADNPKSDACGIPQAMNNCSYGFSPKVQIAWGLRYIWNRYGSPTAALAAFYSRKPHWY